MASHTTDPIRASAGPDNANLDKAKRLLWPIKKKYGKKISWADLMLYTGHVALESMGLPVFGFAFGRVDQWEPEEDVYWGQETKWLAAERGGLGAELEQPLGAVQMGLIYVNPEGPGGKPDPLLAAHDIRETFARMAMNDEETVALIAGGHTFGKAHGAADPSKHVGPEPEGARIEDQGLGWLSSHASGKGADTITSGLEGAWTAAPAKWDHGYFENLYKHEWVQTTSPAGATQWVPAGTPEELDGWRVVDDAHDEAKKHLPIMFTTDLALKADPAYAVISKRFHDDPAAFAAAFARAWYKLTHRDLGPHSRCLGSLVPEAQIWQDPVPPAAGPLIGAAEIAELKASITACAALSSADLVRTAWASASTYRATDHRGGANGARLRLSPQKDWAVNEPEELSRVLAELEGIRSAFNAKEERKRLARGPHRPRRLHGRRGGRQGRGLRGVDRALHAGPHRRDGRADRRRVVRRPRADRRRLPQLPPDRGAAALAARARGVARGAPRRPREHAHPLEGGDGRPPRRHACPRRDRRRGQRRRRPHAVGRHAEQRLFRQPMRHGDDVGARGGQGRPL